MKEKEEAPVVEASPEKSPVRKIKLKKGKKSAKKAKKGK